MKCNRKSDSDWHCARKATSFRSRIDHKLNFFVLFINESIIKGSSWRDIRCCTRHRKRKVIRSINNRSVRIKNQRILVMTCHFRQYHHRRRRHRHQQRQALLHYRRRRPKLTYSFGKSKIDVYVVFMYSFFWFSWINTNVLFEVILISFLLILDNYLFVQSVLGLRQRSGNSLAICLEFAVAWWK